MKLFLDDIRDPPDRTWMIARSCAEAIAIVAKYGFPDVVSFDHDLGEGPTGIDFARHLIDLDLDNQTMPDNFTFIVHSANPVGGPNITALMDRYLRFRKE